MSPPLLGVTRCRRKDTINLLHFNSFHSHLLLLHHHIFFSTSAFSTISLRFLLQTQWASCINGVCLDLQILHSCCTSSRHSDELLVVVVGVTSPYYIFCTCSTFNRPILPLYWAGSDWHSINHLQTFYESCHIFAMVLFS